MPPLFLVCRGNLKFRVRQYAVSDLLLFSNLQLLPRYSDKREADDHCNQLNGAIAVTRKS